MKILLPAFAAAHDATAPPDAEPPRPAG